MTEGDLITNIATLSPQAMIIAWLIWERGQMRAERRDDEAARAARDEKRMEADKALAASLAALTTTIQMQPRS